ncbi:unnamed protein product [marine sediment metagenome]|uniref:Methyltransferase domain-containing protein n=1 Tax=marine sediment metagenome TaxID=412755 RepID=X1BCS5_9ZZZZ
MTKDVKSELLEKYHEFRSESIGFIDDIKSQKYYDNIVKYNYLPNFKENYCHILEIGCYLGYTLTSIKKLNQFEKIEGIDISDSAVKLARKYTGIGDIYCANVFNFLPTKESSYDVIIMKAVLEHINKEQIGNLLKLIYLALKPGGIALISVPNMDWISAMHERYMDFTHEVGFTLESLLDVINVNFDKAAVKTMQYDFINSFGSYIRISFLKPIVKFFIKTVFLILGQGAYRKTLF